MVDRPTNRARREHCESTRHPRAYAAGGGHHYVQGGPHHQHTGREDRTADDDGEDLDLDSPLRPTRVVTIAASSAGVRLIPGRIKPPRIRGPEKTRVKPRPARGRVRRFKREFRRPRTTRLNLRLHVPGRRPRNMRMAQT